MQHKIYDIHCHLLPGIDDGPSKVEESLEMVVAANKQGVETIFATPHYIPGEIEYEKTIVGEKIGFFQDKIDDLGINCKILPGMELYLTPELITHIDTDRVLTLGDSKYFLVEFPSRDVSRNLIDLLYEINIRGYKVILAHPERNGRIIENPELLNEILQHNVLLQVNAASILGKNGQMASNLAKELLQQGLVSFIASDGHSVGRRAIFLRDAYHEVTKLLKDSEKVANLFYKNSLKVSSGEEVFRGGELYTRRRRGLFGVLKKIIR